MYWQENTFYSLVCHTVRCDKILVGSRPNDNFHENMSIHHQSDLRYSALQQTAALWNSPRVVCSCWSNKLSVYNVDLDSV